MVGSHRNDDVAGDGWPLALGAADTKPFHSQHETEVGTRHCWSAHRPTPGANWLKVALRIEQNEATVIEGDIEAVNGVIHVIDALMIPDSVSIP